MDVDFAALIVSLVVVLVLMSVIRMPVWKDGRLDIVVLKYQHILAAICFAGTMALVALLLQRPVAWYMVYGWWVFQALVFAIEVNQGQRK